jgi:hypothetical protein
MDFLRMPAQWLAQVVPEPLPESPPPAVDNSNVWIILGLVALVVLLLLVILLSRLLGRRGPEPLPKVDLVERLAQYPAPATKPGPRRLTYEGVPVRLRLVVLAPPGRGKYAFSHATLYKILDRLVPGLGFIAAHDEARVRIWPAQLSYEGFKATFHRNTPLPEGEDNPSHWIPVAGRIKVRNKQLLLGLALWTEETTSLPRRMLDPHQWSLVFRVKTIKE